MPSINLGKVKGDKGISFRHRGDWNNVEQYVNDAIYIDTVSHNGNLWTCMSTNQNVEPSIDAPEWNLSAESVANVFFEEAETRENLTSGEEVSKAFGKISKWFSDLTAAAFSAIANDTVTEAEGSVLDARQGKVINDRIDKIYADKLVTLDEIDLVTEEGFFVDALSTKELNSKLNSSTLYSTEEIVVGTWFDGRPIYRKCIDFGLLSGSSPMQKAHGIESIDRMVHIYGCALDTTSSSRLTVPLPFVSMTSAAGNINVNANNTNAFIYFGDGRSGFYAFIVFEYIKL